MWRKYVVNAVFKDGYVARVVRCKTGFGFEEVRPCTVENTIDFSEISEAIQFVYDRPGVVHVVVHIWTDEG